ncbi:hypothetical protein BH10ACI3_BH10ACI3_13330 [soil metagenome]
MIPLEPWARGLGECWPNVCTMFSSKMTGFYKNEECPSSNELLEFQIGDLSRTRGSEINKHLAACEFCSAEVEFYTHYPQEEGSADTVESTEIPAPLFELAEALLKNRNGDSHSLNALLKENEELIKS